MTEESPESKTLEQPSTDQQIAAALPNPVPIELTENGLTASVPENTEPVAGNLAEVAEKASSAKRFFPLDPRSIRVEQVTGLIIFLALAIAALVGLIISYFAGEQPNWIWWTVAGGIAAAACLLFLLTLYWPVWEYRYVRWAWDEDGLEIHRGVFWQHRITVPISRIQHVDVSQGPLQRQFGLGKVTVHTAGTQHAAIELSGIAYEAAVWLREQIIAGQGGQDAV